MVFSMKGGGSTPPPKDPYWKKYIIKISMIGGSINPAGQNGSREERGRLCEPRTGVKYYDNLTISKSCLMIFRKEKVKDSPPIIFC